MKILRTVNIMLKRTGVELVRRDRRSGGRVKGMYDPLAWGGGIHPSELADAMRRQDRTLRDAPDWKLFDALIAGYPLRSVPLLTGERVYNKVTDTLLEETLPAILTGTPGPTQDGQVRYLAVGTDYKTNDYTDSQLVREVLRKTPITQSHNGKYAQFYLFLDTAEANGAQTEIVAGTNNQLTIKVDSVAGMAVGDAIRVSTAPQASFSRIASIVGTQITFDPAEPLLTVPAVGQSVLVCIGEVGSFANTDAGPGVDTGDMFSRARLRWPKTNPQAMMIRVTLFGEPG